MIDPSSAEVMMRQQASGQHGKMCWESKAGCYAVRLWQEGPDDFTVTYGLQIEDHLDYADAAREMGECIMHMLSCEQVIDNSDPDEDTD